MQSEPSPASIGVRLLARPEQGGPTDPSHDERLKRGIIHTDVSRGLSVAMTALFLLLIYAVPVGQVVHEKMNGDDVQLLDLFKHTPTRERLHQFEDDLEQASRAKELVQPQVQALLTRFGRVGNKQAVVGLQG